MIKKLVFITILFTSLGQAQSLEDTIYKHLDAFVENPSPKSLQNLNQKVNSFTLKAKTKNEYLALVILHSNMAYYRRQYGEFKKAVFDYENAWALYKTHQLQDYDIIEYCLKPLGNLYTQLGDFANAERTIKRYISFAEEQKNLSQKIAGIINLSVVYHTMGKHSTAIELLHEGLDTPDVSAEQKAALENNMATNLMAKEQFDKAKSYLDNTSKNEVLNLRNKAQLAMNKGDYDQALLLLEQAEPLLMNEVPLARDLARFYVEKASIYASMKAFEKAFKAYRKALQTLLPLHLSASLPPQELLYAENTFISIFDGLASLQTFSKLALSYYDLSFYVSDLIYDQFTNEEVKIMHQSSWKRRTERCLKILLDEHNENPQTELVKRAFTYVEKSKARVLNEQISQQFLLKSNANDELLLKRDELKTLQQKLINVSIREQLTDANSLKLQVVSDSLTQIHLELKKIQSAIADKYQEESSSLVSFDEIQTKVKEDESVLILYFYGKNNVYRIVISEKSIDFNSIEDKQFLDKKISDFIAYFDKSSAINNDIAGFSQTAFSLYNLLMPKKPLESDNLVIIPDALLHFIPFESLLVKPTKSSSYAKMPFLIKDSRLSYNNSATLYHKAEMSQVKNSVLGVFPVFENTSKYLNYSLEESKNLKEILPARLLMHDQASKSNFKALAGEYSILHLSTHAYSGTFTIPAYMEFDEDVMLLQELYSLNLNPKLVVLSACETGVGKILTGEGPMSLARGFQYAGAQNLLFSLWKVNDLSTSQLMTSFYKYYSQTNSASLANRNSKLDFLNNEHMSNANKSPYYWSAFVYYGDVDKGGQKPNYLWVYLIIGLVIVLGGREILKSPSRSK